MNTVRMESHRLRKAVEANLTKHVEEFNEASEAYFKLRKEHIAKLHKTDVKDVEATGKILMDLNRMVRPVSHEKNYRRTLNMLDYHTESHSDLSEKSFSELVNDDWDWKQEFRHAYSSNTGKAY